MQLTKKALATIFALAAIFASTSVLASIPRSEILTPRAIDLRYELASPPPTPGDNNALLARALDRAMPRPAPLARYAETRVGASDLFAPFEQQQPSGLTRALRKASAFRGFESASDETFCGGDPVNCSDPTGERAMTAEDTQQLAMLKARGRKLHDDFTSTGRADFGQYLLVPVEHPWWDTSGPIGGDYTQQLVPSTVTTADAYYAARQSMVNDVAAFQAAVARADANGEIYYVAGQGFTTITAADASRATTATMVAAGIFFATDAVPMVLSPFGYRGTVSAEPVQNLRGNIRTVRSIHESAEPGPYAHLQDPPSVGHGKEFTRAQRQKAFAANRALHENALVDDVTLTPVLPGQQHVRGVTPPPNEAQLDHIVPVSVGGKNSYRNLRIRTRANNLKKGAGSE